MILHEYFIKRQSSPKSEPVALSVLCARPETEPKFVIQIIHGISERKERYLNLLEKITSFGGIALIHDLRGHGNTVKSREELGYFGDFGYSYNILCDDIDIVYASIASKPENFELLDNVEISSALSLPRYLMGFSMGALIASIYTSRRAKNLSGVILSGLPHREIFVSVGLLGLNILSLIGGEDWKPKLLNKYAFNRYNRHFRKEPDSDGQFLWLSNDIDNRVSFASDPICNHQKTLNAYENLLRLVRDTYRPSSWDMECPNLPILITAGEFDPIAGGDKAILWDAKFFTDIGFTNVKTTMYHDMRHEIYFDFGKDVPISDLLKFCEENLASVSDNIDKTHEESV